MPELHDNLLSVESMENRGNTINFVKGRCIIYDPKGHVVATGTRPQDGRLYALNLHKIIISAAFKTVPTTNAQDLAIWHHRLGHMGSEQLKELQNHVTDMKITDSSKNSEICEGCILGKSHKTISRAPMPKAPTKLG